jgi:hypothetical protein
MCFFTIRLREIANVALSNVLRSAFNGLSKIFNALFLLKYITALFFIITGFDSGNAKPVPIPGLFEKVAIS